jgi:hypothetical protein
VARAFKSDIAVLHLFGGIVIPIANKKKLLFVVPKFLVFPRAINEWLMDHKAAIEAITSLKCRVGMIPGITVS